MSEILIKTLKGHSDSKVELIKKDNLTIVRKTYNIERNLLRSIPLINLGLDLPIIRDVKKEYYDMDYVPHHNMSSWLMNNKSSDLTEFIKKTISCFRSIERDKDYTSIYWSKLESLPVTLKQDLPFSIEELINSLPKVLPQSEYHGDFTLENIIYNEKNGFYLIDPLESVYDSWVFDLAKLRQDVVCKWFLRNSEIDISPKLKTIQKNLSGYPYFNDNSLLILMLLRVLPYAKDKNTYNWLLKEINKLWK